MLPLTSILSHPESAHLEGKSAKGGFPDSFWESYSAFANSDGGVIGLGVEEDKNGKLFVKDVKLPTLGKEPDMEAMAEFYPDEEASDNQETSDKPSDKYRHC